MTQKTLVIGAGFAGLSLAGFLRKQGHDVLLLDQNEAVGGRARLWETQGYSFDMGPSWYLMPEVFEAYFAHFGKKREDYYPLKALDPYYKIFFEKDDPISVPREKGAIRELFARLEPGGDRKLDAFLERAQYKYETAMRDFLYKDYKKISDFFSGRVIREGLKLDLFSSLHSSVKGYFKDHRAQKILEYAMVFLGNSPKNAPALYTLMSHVDLNLGVDFPKGGMNGVAQALARLLEELGGKIRLNTKVKKILTREGKAYGVMTEGGEEILADAVFMAGDYSHGELDLLDDSERTYKRKYWEKKTWAPSMFLAYLGINKTIPSLEHHNLYFSHDWDRHFDTIFKTRTWPENPCFYLSAITKTDPTMAPKGKENLFLLVPTAPGLDDSEEVRLAYFEKTLSHVEKVIGEPLAPHAEVTRLFSHRDFIQDYNAWQGTALGLAHTLFQTAIFRPAHRSKKVKGLYYTGQNTHPGVGVPMTLIASQIVAEEYAKDRKER